MAFAIHPDVPCEGPERKPSHLMICRASWRPLGERAWRASAAAVALLLCSIGVGRLLATISRWLTCSDRRRGQASGVRPYQLHGRRRRGSRSGSGHRVADRISVRSAAGPGAAGRFRRIENGW